MRKRKAINSFTTKKGFIDIGDKSSYRKANSQYIAKLGKI